MKIVIYGDPIAKARARYSKRGKHVITYDSQKHLKNAVRSQFLDALSALVNSDDKSIMLDACKIACSNSFEVNFTFYLPIPKSDPTSLRHDKLWGFEHPTCKPDCDNLEKFYLDCANGIFWNDDSMVVQMSSKKLFSSKPRTEIEIMAKKELKVNGRAKDVITIFSPDSLKEMLYDIRSMATVDPEGMEVLEGNDLEMWIHSTARLIGDFSSKYASIMQKVKSKSGNDIVRDINDFLECKKHLEDGTYEKNMDYITPRCRQASTTQSDLENTALL